MAIKIEIYILQSHAFNPAKKQQKNNTKRVSKKVEKLEKPEVKLLCCLQLEQKDNREVTIPK